MNEKLFEAVDDYVAGLFAPEDEALGGVEASLREAGMPQISVSPTQGKLLQVLALLCKAKKILEIGTLGGYSSIWMARALPEDGRLISLEYEPRHAAVARKNLGAAGLASKVEVREGRALDLLPKLEAEGAGPFDMVFIDADKAPYTEYLQWTLRLTHAGSLIVADNVVRDGRVLDAAARDQDIAGVRGFNAALAAEPRVAAIVLQTIGVKGHDGMAVAVVR